MHSIVKLQPTWTGFQILFATVKANCVITTVLQGFNYTLNGHLINERCWIPPQTIQVISCRDDDSRSCERS